MVRLLSSFLPSSWLILSRDQELRFTVHESPDYLRLKVSIFNDDKRTDLIGENWIDLGDVIIPGGGQNDKWHGLQCKGKYAGEIRMEMTFYDTRPKDDAVIERRKEAERKEARADARQAGTRLSKQTRRRPLPADPTGGPGSRPGHSEHPKLQGPRSNEPRSTPPPRPQKAPDQVPRPRSSNKRETPEDPQRQYRPRANSAAPPPDPRDSYQPDQHAPRHVPMPMPMPQEYTHAPPQDYHQAQDPYYPPEQNAAYREVYDAPPRQENPGMMVEHRQNTYPPARVPVPVPVPVHDTRGYYHRNSIPPGNDMQYVPGQVQVRRQDYMPQFQEPEEEGPPPPPPIHRHPVGRPAPQQRSINEPAPVPAPVPMPEPLSIAPGRITPNMHLSRDVPQNYVAYSPNHTSENFPPENASMYSASPAPSYHSERPYSRSRPTTATGEVVPAPLVAGYNPTVVDEAEEMAMEYQPYNSALVQAAPLQHASRAEIPAERPSSSRSFQDPRQTIPRKSISPQPPPQSNPDSLAGVPFSPDSYDVLNPNVANAAAVRQPGANYCSPAEAMEAARQFEVDKRRGLGPIVGNDGRLIDPSDHLPADTWAPEPERKTRKPEVVVRFKHANAIGPRPVPKDQPSTSQHVALAHGTSSSSQLSGRDRLQKRPQSYTPSRGNPPLSDRHNFVAHTPPSQPPSYTARQPSPNPTSRYSPTTSNAMTISRNYAPPVGPPIPAKVPVQPAPQNGGMDALSDEMRRIDIGGSVGRKARHSYAGGY